MILYYIVLLYNIILYFIIFYFIILYKKRIYYIIIIIIIIIIIWSPLCKAGREWEHSISPKTPTPRNQPMEGRKR